MTTTQTGQIVARKIKEHRAAAGLSLAAMGERLKAEGQVQVSYPGTLLKIERGERPIRVDELEAFAAALRVSMGDLLGESSPFAVQAWRTYADAHQAMRTAVAAYLDAGWNLLAMTDGEDEKALPKSCPAVVETLVQYGPLPLVAAEVLAWIRENRPEGEGLPESVVEYFRER